MISRRRAALTLSAGVLAPRLAFAQQKPAKVFQVGVLGVVSAVGYARQVEALRKGFRDLGYVEGQNLNLEFRWADSRFERLPALAAELIRLGPDAIITSGQGVSLLQDATSTIPLVMAVGTDRAVASLARPGGNLTGSRPPLRPNLPRSALKCSRRQCLTSGRSRF
jgi:putative ABC transport system substrate-binding protein